MRIAFLILAHRKPELLGILTEMLLRYDQSYLYIHIDKKTEDDFKKLKNEFQRNDRVHFIEETYKVYWGSYNQIRATVELLETSFNSGIHDYYCLLSGQDLPVKPLDEFSLFLQKNNGYDFIDQTLLPKSEWVNGGFSRIKYYSIDIEGHGYLTNKLNSIITRIQNTFGLYKKLRYKYYGGANWFTLTSESVKLIFKFLSSDKKYLNHFRFTRTADEIFIQTILLNSERKHFVISKNLRFIDWVSGPEYPRIIRETDFERMKADPEAFFARKFDADIDESIIKKVYEYCA